MAARNIQEAKKQYSQHNLGHSPINWTLQSHLRALALTYEKVHRDAYSYLCAGCVLSVKLQAELIYLLSFDEDP